MLTFQIAGSALAIGTLAILSKYEKYRMDKEFKQYFMTPSQQNTNSILLPDKYDMTEFVPRFHNLQPQTFENYIGQEDVKTLLLLEIHGALRNNIPLRHILLYGKAGTGKTTLAKIIAKAVDKPFFEVTASGIDNLDKLMDLVDKINTIGKEGSILFIDEIHLLKREIQTHLYSLMTDNRITLNKRGVVETINITPMTIIGATTYMGELDEAFRSRFDLPLKLTNYTTDQMKEIITRNAQKLEMTVETDVFTMLALNCRKSPRVANSLLVTSTRLTDGILTVEDVGMLFRMLKVFPDGLQIPHISILYALAKADKQSLGLNTLAKIIQEDVISIKDEWENYLLSEGYVTVSRGLGRTITEKGLKYLDNILKNETFKNELKETIK